MNYQPGFKNRASRKTKCVTFYGYQFRVEGWENTLKSYKK